MKNNGETNREPGLDVRLPEHGTPVPRGNRMVHPIPASDATPPIPWWGIRDVSASAERTSTAVKPDTSQFPTAPVNVGSVRVTRA
jgi:hypothetical protein